ncbi:MULTISPECIES: hypothetical protein [unclassified Novosphingobium]|nr:MULTISPECIES: hypothetical protein [unclassified Novosphingobium]MBB3558412.1 hypothetical protein [Novosphingobium sp. BK349]MBB3654466.1 hypothetical protein [Novosphingobium sp. BK626]MBB3360177.1 hypothetical protein [Novosphingobium sp. BK256]MBB3376644.1 hypothetical protein [Novosphingobium sp. BK280]MBB3381057.1 hypothetical protein [Novosphingobium sp. BK258]
MSADMTQWRPQFQAALEKLAEISSAMDELGLNPPILVGGGAVELYTQGAINTGDFDLVTSQQSALESVMVEHGFVRPRGAGRLTRGWIHPSLKLGFEVVGSRLLDGHADTSLLQLIEVGAHGTVAVISIEDLIADRMGQYASGAAHDMIGQAQALFTLSEGLDTDYMERRIREETIDTYGVQDLKADARDDQS